MSRFARRVRRRQNRIYTNPTDGRAYVRRYERERDRELEEEREDLKRRAEKPEGRWQEERRD